MSPSRKRLAPYFCVGFPSAKETAALLDAAVAAGADAIELGVPFSDPLADGPAIQHASQEALRGGMTLAGALDLATAFTARHRIPLYLMSYANPILATGADRFAERARETGIAGLILPDLPPEEWDRVGSAEELPRVPLVAPNTPDGRIRQLASGEPPFLYCVSVLGVTGAREGVAATAGGFLDRVKSLTDVPALVGFGVSTPEDAAALAAHADGVIVGSALVERIRRGESVGPFLASLRAALDAAPRTA